jgi:hypothetical protein
VFTFQDTSEAVAAILNGHPTPIRNRNPSLGADLARIIDRAVAREASQRFSSALEMQAALSPFSRRKP